MSFERDLFITEINLTEFAASLGYQIDRSKSTKSSVVMKGAADKVVIKKKSEKWVYFSVSDDADKGTIIDFALNRTGAKYWQVCQTLNDWVGGRAKRPDIKSYESNVVEQAYNPGRVASIFSRCTQGGGSTYLNSRGLDNETLNSDRFHGRVYSDRHGNVVFPHFRGKAICGLELKNADKAVFVRGGEKTLWRSNMFQDDETLIISEAVLDALSYHQIQKTAHAMYVATGGGLSPNQTQIIKNFVVGFKNIILIVDNDKGGDRLFDRLQDTIAESGFKGDVKRHSPETRGDDWNDMIKPEQGRAAQ